MNKVEEAWKGTFLGRTGKKAGNTVKALGRWHVN